MSNAGIRVQRPAGSVLPADGHEGRRLKEKEKVRALEYLRFLTGWRVCHLAKTVTNKCRLLSVLGNVAFHYFDLIQSQLEAGFVKIFILWQRCQLTRCNAVRFYQSETKLFELSQEQRISHSLYLQRFLQSQWNQTT